MSNFSIGLIGLVLLITYLSIAEIYSEKGDDTLCYAKAMIGHDSVINKQAGTPLLTSLSIDNRDEYDRIIKEAYTTELSAHEYGLGVYTRCITK